MVSSRNRSAAAAAAAAAAATTSENQPTTSTTTTTTTSNVTTSGTRVPKPPLEDWTIKEKLCLASLAIKFNNSWNTVARNMQTFVGKEERQDGRYNQKTCAAQFDKLMNELGVDKRPRRNEQSDTSGSVIYKKMAEKRIKELEESTVELRKRWLTVCNDLKVLESSTTDKSEPVKSKTKPTSTPAKTPSRTSTSGEVEKPPTRALTRRESSRQNLEKTLSVLHKEASEVESIGQLCKPKADVERTLGSYDKYILKHVDLSVIKRRLGSEIEDPYEVMNELLLMFQNGTMYYPPDHPNYKLAVELREKLLPQWERSLIPNERYKNRH